MHIALITFEYPPYRVGGLGTHCQELAGGLVARGHQVEVFSFCMDREWNHDDHGVSVHHLKFPFEDRMSVYDGRTAEIPILAERMTSFVAAQMESIPDIIHSHEWIGYMAAQPLSAFLHRPMILTMHGLWLDVLAPWRNHPEYVAIARLEAESCQQASRVIAVSASLKSHILQAFQLPHERVEVIPNGCDSAIFESLNNADEQALWHQLKKEGRRVIVFAGRIGAQKGVVALLSSARLVLERCRDVSYVFAGERNDGPYLDTVYRAIEEFRLSEHAHFVGKLPRHQLADLYHHANLAVIPSNYEPFGYAASEAMLAGVPVVASAVDGLTEIIDHEENGLLVAFDTSDDRRFSRGYTERLAAAQVRLLEDEPFAAALAAKARTKARIAFGRTPMVDRTLNLYAQVLSEWHESINCH